MVTPTEVCMRRARIARRVVQDALSTFFSNWASWARLAGAHTPGPDISTQPRPVTDIDLRGTYAATPTTLTAQNRM
jgi:hypothetical protein